MRQRSTDANPSALRHGRFQFTDQEFKALADLLERRCGLTFSIHKQRELQLKLNKLGDAVGDSAETLMNALSASDETLQMVINALTVGESYFFRNRPHFKALTSNIIPTIIREGRERKSLKIWCAGCARGEEPYSVAMLLFDRFPVLKSWEVSIAATDINTSFLEEARKGVYRKWSFRGVESTVLEEHFKRSVDGDYRLHDNIKRNVVFKHFNLVDLKNGARPVGDDLDLILCRNVFIYFPFNTADRLIAELRGLMRPGGFLLVGHSEAFPELGNFEVIYSNATYYYRKHSDFRDARVSLPAFPTATIPGIAVKPTVVPPPATMDLTPDPTEQREPSSAPTSDHGDKDVNRLLDEARSLANRGQTLEAIELLTTLSANQGQLDHRVHFVLALLTDQAGDVDRAMESLKRSIFLEKGFIIGHYYLGVILQREGEMAAAKRHFKNVIRLLGSLPDDYLLEESEGLNAGRLKEIVTGRAEEVDRL